jgi:hypothetical protein
MRRIYESGALHRDDDESFSPRERDDVQPRAMRSLDASALSRRLVPTWVRHRAITVDVSTPRPEYPVGTAVPFEVTMKNAAPFPVTVAVKSRRPWTWAVDGATDAARISLHDAPDDSAGFHFDRGERKRFRKRWHGSFQVSESEWKPATPGEYVIEAGLNVADDGSLSDETTVRLVPGRE